MWQKIDAFFLYDNHLQQLHLCRGRSFLLLTALFFVLQLAAVIFWRLSQESSFVFTVVAVAGLLVLLLPLIILRRSQNIKATCQTMLLGHFLLYTAVISLTGLYHSPLLMSLFYIPLIALLSGDAKLSVHWSLYCLLLFLVALVLSQMTLTLPDLNESQHEFWYQWSIINAVLISGFLAMAYNRTLAIMANNMQQQRQAFEQDTFTDNLTLLANAQQLKRSIKTLQVHQAPVFLLSVDVVGFQAINERYGHHTGDQVLQALAIRLLACVSQKDIVARVTADQFLLVLTGITTGQEQKALEAAINLQLAKDFYTERHHLFLSCRLQGFCLQTADAIEPLSQFFTQKKLGALC